MILQRYLIKTILFAIIAVTVSMLALTFLINLLGELHDIGIGDYGFIEANIHVLAELPQNLYAFFPVLVLLGGVIGLGILASNNELTVMRSSGLSIQQLIFSVIKAAVVVIIVATVMGECIAPQANYFAEKRKQSMQNRGQAIATVSGVWVHEGNNFLHIKHMVGLHHLEGVTRYEFDNEHRLLASSYIQSIDFVSGKWVLHDVVTTSFEQNRVSNKTIATSGWDLKLNPHLLSIGLIEPPEMSLRNLHDYSKNLSQNGLQANNFKWEFWKRLFQPFTTLVMLLLAIPFILYSSRSITMGKKIVISVSIGFAFYILNAFLGEISIVLQFSPFFAALIPTALFALLGLALMWRLRLI